MKKHIYFLRHGETLGNRRLVHQGPDEPLTQKGRKQALHAALILRDKGIDTVICSTFARARETAAIIAEELGLPISADESLVEFRRPYYLYDRGHYSFGSLAYLWPLFIHRENPDWNDDGAENMFSVRNRVLDAKRMLASLEGERIVAVSHAIFMDMFLELACREKKLTFFEYFGGLINLKKTPNTGIIHLLYDENAPQGICPWQLIEFINPKERG